VVRGGVREKNYLFTFNIGSSTLGDSKIGKYVLLHRGLLEKQGQRKGTL